MRGKIRAMLSALLCLALCLGSVGAAESRDPGERLDLYDAIDRLSFPEQTVIKLRYFEDMKLEEIAQATGANLNTVKSRLYKAIRKLKDMTGEEIDYAP